MDDATMRVIDDKDRMIRELIKENLSLKNRISLMCGILDAGPVVPKACDCRPECSACLPSGSAPVAAPAVREEAFGVRGGEQGESEVRDAEAHREALAECLAAWRRDRGGERPERRAILDGMRLVLADPEGCGSRYCHAAACQAVDAAMEG